MPVTVTTYIPAIRSLSSCGRKVCYANYRYRIFATEVVTVSPYSAQEAYYDSLDGNSWSAKSVVGPARFGHYTSMHLDELIYHITSTGLFADPPVFRRFSPLPGGGLTLLNQSSVPMAGNFNWLATNTRMNKIPVVGYAFLDETTYTDQLPYAVFAANQQGSAWGVPAAAASSGLLVAALLMKGSAYGGIPAPYLFFFWVSSEVAYKLYVNYYYSPGGWNQTKILLADALWVYDGFSVSTPNPGVMYVLYLATGPELRLAFRTTLLDWQTVTVDPAPFSVSQDQSLSFCGITADGNSNWMYCFWVEQPGKIWVRLVSPGGTTITDKTLVADEGVPIYHFAVPEMYNGGGYVGLAWTLYTGDPYAYPLRHHLWQVPPMPQPTPTPYDYSGRDSYENMPSSVRIGALRSQRNTGVRK
jgi:hypothetical protein